MFFKQVWRNYSRSRKENGIFLGSLIIAIVAFYTLLSLGEQDVMRFLSAIESDAVRKLLALLPVVYMVSLFFVFFLVYFACKYQADRRRREFGMYLMLGMKRSRLFFMLFCETLCSSLVSLLIGIPAALFLTEGISLATAKIAGLGIIGHHFSISFHAVIWTVCGFIIVQFLSMLIICIQLGKTEPVDFLQSSAVKKQVSVSRTKGTVFFASGAVLLIAAYYLGIAMMKTYRIDILFTIVTCGILGTFFLYQGLGGFLGRRIQKKSAQAIGLKTFTARQIQESVFSQHKSLAVSSLLLLIALSCISFGISLGLVRTSSSHSADFSLFGDKEQIDSILDKDNIQKMVKDSYPMYLSFLKDKYWKDGEKKLDLSKLKNEIRKIKDTENILESLHLEYVISESSYNRMMKNMGKTEINLQNKVALYTSIHRDETFFYSVLEQVVKNKVSIGINGTNYTILPALYYDNIVADRAITLYMALIVPDTLYHKLARELEPYCYNVHLAEDVTKELGLMQAIQQMDGMLEPTGIEYDSYLAGIGRNLFYTISASYLTIYLGLLFLIIANTVIGMKFLIQHRQTKHRYVTLAMLGADIDSMCRSVRKQIQTFFLLVLSVSLVSSAAAIFCMFTSFTKLPASTSWYTITALAVISLFVFVIVETTYISIIKRAADHEIRSLEIADDY